MLRLSGGASGRTGLGIGFVSFTRIAECRIIIVGNLGTGEDRINNETADDRMMKILRRLYQLVAKRSRAVVFLPALLAGCAPLGVLDAIVPEGDYDRRLNVAYGPEARQKLDIYRPKNATTGSPVIVFFYGGSWKSGDRGRYRFVADALTQHGYTVVIPDYRLYPDVRFPDFMHDAANTLRWVKDNLTEPDGSTPPVFLAGHSAGAHIAALLAVDDAYLQKQGLSPQDICGVIGLAGPYTFDPFKYRTTRAVFQGLNNSDEARPVAQVKATAPPFLLLHGTEDGTVSPENTVGFAEKLIQAGGSAETVMIPDIGHYRIILAVARPFDDIAPVNDRIADFIDHHRACKPQ